LLFPTVLHSPHSTQWFSQNPHFCPFLEAFLRYFHFCSYLNNQRSVSFNLVYSSCSYLSLSASILFAQFHQAVVSKFTFLCLCVRFFEVFSILLISQLPGGFWTVLNCSFQQCYICPIPPRRSPKICIFVLF